MAMDEKRYRQLLDDAYARVDRAFEQIVGKGHGR
jgi:hypothetical protein